MLGMSKVDISQHFRISSSVAYALLALEVVHIPKTQSIYCDMQNSVPLLGRNWTL